MKAFPFLILAAVVLAACHRDPFARLMHQVSEESGMTHLFFPIKLPPDATPEQLISALSKRRSNELGHFDFQHYKISEIRPVQTEPPVQNKFTAVLLDTELGRKIVLLQPMQRGTNWDGWYYRTYDAK